MLTSRAKKIVACITRFPEGCPITLAMIADEIGCSTRSVHRELPDIEKWMQKQGYNFERKRGQGLILHENKAVLEEIRNMLSENTTSSDQYADRDFRQDTLLKELLFSDEPVKTAYFCHKYGISEKTLSADLNTITDLLAHFHLDLIRKPGLGIYVSGSEISLRRAFSNVIRKEMTESNISQALHRRELPASCRKVPFLDVDFFLILSDLLSAVEEELHLYFPDQDYISFLLYLTITMQRIEHGHTVTDLPNKFEDIYLEPEYAVAEYLMDAIKKELGTAVSSIEICWISIALTGAHIWPTEKNNFTETPQINLYQLILDIVSGVCDELHVDLMRDRNLISDLSNHLRPMIGRLRAGIPIDNPLLSIMKEEYREIYTACCSAKKCLRAELGIQDVPESEIGFLTMHFGAALERLNMLNQRIKAVVVCPSGIGTSRLLAATLKKEYPDLQLLGTHSILSLDPIDLSNKNVDLIISTVPLAIDYPNVQVSPILNKQDILFLNAKLDQLSSLKTTTPKLDAPTTASIDWSDLSYLEKLGDEIRYTFDHILLGRAPVLHSKAEVLSYAASLFADSEDEESHLLNVIKKREDLGDTYIKSFHMLLLHGKTNVTKHALFGYVSLKPPVYEQGRMILGAIVSFIPEQDNDPIYAKIISEIIGALMDHNQLLNALRESDTDSFLYLLEKILLDFYRRETADRLYLSTERF